MSSKTVGGLTVLVLDRWSVKGMSDATLAAKGVPIAPHTDTRYYDQNKGKTYTVPVNPSAPIVVNTCVKNGSNPPTMTSTPVSLSDWLASVRPVQGDRAADLRHLGPADPAGHRPGLLSHRDEQKRPRSKSARYGAGPSSPRGWTIGRNEHY